MVSFTTLPLYPAERAPSTHPVGDWVGPRAGLEDVKEFLTLRGFELLPLLRPAHSYTDCSIPALRCSMLEVLRPKISFNVDHP
jgi:hypothetical protein